MSDAEVSQLKREYEWLKAALILQHGEATLAKWIEGHSFYMQGMLDERALWEKIRHPKGAKNLQACNK